jgi:cell filamentation protein
MYEAIVDPYCYSGSTVLKNIPGLRSQRALDRFEAAITAQRADEPLPSGRLSVAHYRAVHHHLFQDVYAWAGRFRTVRISKGSRPCSATLKILRKKWRDCLRRCGGNMVCVQAGHEMSLTRLHPESFLAAMIRSFSHGEGTLAREIRAMLL